MDFVTCPHCGQMQALPADGRCIKCKEQIHSQNINGLEANSKSGINEKKVIQPKNQAKRSKSKYTAHIVFACLSFAAAAFSVLEGFDKYTNYYNSEYSTILNENAYVGGDAYNYIINASYMTAFFVLALVFVVLGVGAIIVRQLCINGDKIELE